MKHSITNKMLMISLLPAAATLFVLLLHSSWQQYESLGSALKERGSAIARQLAPACEYGVFSGNKMILQTLVSKTSQENDVAGVFVLDAGGEILAYAPRNNQSVIRLSDISSRHVYRADIIGSQMKIEADELYGMDLNPGTQLNKIGTVIVRMDDGRTQKEQNYVLIKNLLISIAGLIVVALFARRMAAALSGPITRLTQSVARIESGELGHRVQGDFDGELGILENGINQMALSLQLSREKDRERADNELYVEKVRAQVTLESIADGVITTDKQGNVVYMNPAAQHMLEFKLNGAGSRHITEVFKAKMPGGKENQVYPIDECLVDGNVIHSSDHRLLTSQSGRCYVIQDNASPLRDRNGDILGAVVVFRDITAMRHMMRRMEYLAHHDSLTGLVNRREFEVRLQQVLDTARSIGGKYVICFLDLDQFKLVNDSSGHEAGDELLRQVAYRLNMVVRSSDVLARLGGDEFGLVLEGCDIDKAQEITRNIQTSIADYQFKWHEKVYDVGVSIGVVAVNADFENIAELIRAADSACYLAKERGPNNIHVYSEDDVELARRHGQTEWLHKLKSALENDGFELHCQRIERSDGANNNNEMYEILLRLESDVITPEVFISAAERYHLMPDIDRWVFEQAFASICDIDESTVFSINISGQSLCDDGFLDYIQQAAVRHNIDWSRICIEITETAAIENLSRAQEFIDKLGALGCLFSLDDFGSGLSSFAYLRNLNVSYLKIDGSFVRDLLSDPIDAAMVGGINEIGHVMNLETVAESVENNEVRDLVSSIGVDYVQGYGVSPVVALRTLITKATD
ncbi:MAG: EAL domain-containing protein [Proteobacteria bacterium]|nr:EAL domain-containing protein [Pseudomonadota bacterium]